MRAAWLLVVLSGLAGCAHGPQRGGALGPTYGALLVEEAQCRAPGPATVSREEALADHAVLERVLRRGYAGFDVLARGGLDWDAVLGDARARIERAPDPLPVETLRQELLAALAPTGDGQLALWSVGEGGRWSWGACGRHLDAYLGDLVLERAAGAWKVRSPSSLVGAVPLECEGRPATEVIRPTFSGGEVTGRVVLLRERPQSDATCKFRRTNGKVYDEEVGLHRMRVAVGEPGGAAYIRSETDGIPVLRLASLAEKSAAELRQFSDSALDLRRAPGIVIDARGNTGGNERYLRDWFLRLTSGSLRQPVSETLRSEVTLQGDANRHRCDKVAAGDDPATAGAAAQGLLASRRALAQEDAARPDGFRAWEKAAPAEQAAAPAPYRGALVVIVDAGCARACESIVTLARQIPGALVVGENTAGIGTFGELRPFRLPRSGLFLQVATRWLHDQEPAPIAREGEGYFPDFWLDDKDPVPAATSLARCVADPTCASLLR